MILPFKITHSLVCKVFNLPEHALYEKSRKPTYLIPRQVFAWHYRAYPKLYPDAAKYLRVDRTTINRSVKVAQTMFETRNIDYYPQMVKFIEQSIAYDLDIEQYFREKGVLMEKVEPGLQNLGAYDKSIEKHCMKKGLMVTSTTTDNPFYIILERRGEYSGLVVVVAPMDITSKEAMLLDVFVQAGYKYWVAGYNFEAIQIINDYVHK